MRHRVLSATLLCCGLALAGAAEPALPTKAQVKAVADQAKAYLLAEQQADGSFMPGDRFKLGITELAANALLDAGVAKDDPAIVKAVAYVTGHIQKDGGIYSPNEGLGNYCTSLGLKLLSRVDHDAKVIKAAQDYLIGIQNTDEKSNNFGGVGYGSAGKGSEDLLNTTYALDALRSSGLPADHPAMQRALKFVERCQNLSSHNDQSWAKKGKNDGSGVYSPDVSKAGGSFKQGGENEAPADGTLEGYGTMTYALISSYLSLNLTADDPRVKAALDWASKNYQFEVNPGMPAAPKDQSKEGLMYYFAIMAKTYALTKAAAIKPGSDWRADLFAAIVKLKQETDGKAFWLNSADRWAEGDPRLVTSYMLGALMRIHDSLP